MYSKDNKITNLQKFTICGFEERVNDILYCPPLMLQTSQKQESVVYFGGDIQDYEENMVAHRDNKNYRQWSLESTAKILQNSFSNTHIIIIKPSRMEYKTFSCFDNFVPSGNCGVPLHNAMHHSIKHLEMLLRKLSHLVYENHENSEFLQHLSNTDISLIGFSKGCVVLNQFLYEFHSLKDSSPEDGFTSVIKNMFWLDGGHSGGKNTWVTSRTILETFSKLGINVHIHVSPYQLQDDRRPWIKKEEKIFYNTLSNYNVAIQRIVHFPEISPNIIQHFSILNEFKRPPSSLGEV